MYFNLRNIFNLIKYLISHAPLFQLLMNGITAVQDISPTSEPTQSPDYREKKGINYAYISLLCLVLIPCSLIVAVYFYFKKNRNAETVREEQRVRVEEAALSATISTQPSNDFVFDSDIILMNNSAPHYDYPPPPTCTYPHVYKDNV